MESTNVMKINYPKTLKSHLSMHTPVGWLRLDGSDSGITAVNFVDADAGQTEYIPQCLLDCRLQLEEYFAGKRRVFELPLRAEGTNFQQQVWDVLYSIPFGVVRSYKDVALTRWNDKTIRAVGTANGQNPIAIIVPCHRVVGSSGDLTGYAGGLWRKKWLLEHEQSVEYGKQGTLF
jgi:methylated-DNA-[protein]-cysteine S-methyltransferase